MHIFCSFRKDHLHSMINVVDTFIPLCHEFLGKVFVKIPWQVLVRPDDENMVKIISSLLHIATKLSSEPQVRQVEIESHKILAIEILFSPVSILVNFERIVETSCVPKFLTKKFRRKQYLFLISQKGKKNLT